ncbi:MAG: Fe-Mn family superoxide dismutase [bacterium]
MTYEIKNYNHLLGLTGFSDQLLNNHFTLYGGYVTNTNKLADRLKELELTESAPTPEYTELKRRFGWEWNGMRLHELYFDNLTKDSSSASDLKISELITKNFGSFENWEKSFRSIAAMRGIGWVILYHDVQADTLVNIWVNEHDAGHLAGAKPLLIMDVFEHSFMLDYGLKRADYINAFFNAINWNSVNNRI